MKKILIVHGWLHSASTYKKLKYDLENKYDLSVTLYEFSGFGDTPAKYFFDILENYTKDMEAYLLKNKFDFIIAHSMGGSIILRVISRKKIKSRIILLSPVYKGINILKPFILLYPLAAVFLCFAKLPFKINDAAIKLLALFTVNRFSLISNNIIADVKKANPFTAAHLMSEMALDSFTALPVKDKSSPVNILIGEKDMVISCRKMLKLKSDLVNCRISCLKNTGHTAAIENYPALFSYLEKLIK